MNEADFWTAQDEADQSRSPDDEPINPHAPYVMRPDPVGPLTASLGVWVECECQWISHSYPTEAQALKAHSYHLAKLHPSKDGS